MMNISETRVEEIFKKLPKGYYLGRDIKVELSKDSNMTYFSPIEDKIVVSLPMIMNTLVKMEIVEGLNNSLVEELVRGLFYHEISHVILTPDVKYVEDALCYTNLGTDNFNIFCDERIETVFKNFYMKVNFKKNVYRIMDGYADENSMDTRQRAQAMFFNIVRFRHSESYPELVEEVQTIIQDHYKVNANSSYAQVKTYIKDVGLLWDKVYDLAKKDIEEDKKKAESESEKGENSNTDTTDMQTENNSSREDSDTPDKENNSQNITQNNSSTEDDETSDKENNSENTTQNNSSTEEGHKDSEDNDTENSDKNNKNTEDTTEDTTEDSDTSDSSDDLVDEDELDDLLKDIDDTLKDITDEQLSNWISKTAKKVFNKYQNEDIKTNLQRVLRKAHTRDGMHKPSSITYQGKINPRLVGSRDDYKWGTKICGNSHLKGKKKLHLTLWVDNSGSFRRNDFRMNQFITALESVTNNNFEYDILTINTRVRELKKGMLFKSEGGNCTLYDKISPLFKKYQKANCDNFNIVLFDGDCHSDDGIWYRSSRINKADKRDGLRCFNSNNCIIVSDSDNAKAISLCAPQARTVITYDYAEEFINEVLSLMERVL